jgi:protein-S-isoprenylcysteine O-methyltransferase Ste14
MAAVRPVDIALGGWLFARRGWLPVPLLVALVLAPPRHWVPGLLVLAVGEGVRLAAVGHIGVPSRTRGSDVGPLVRSGPYGWVRNPLYVGNQLIFAGLGIVAWPAALVVVPLLAAYYGVIVRWEESNLADRLGAPYRAYLADVPRWLPRRPGAGGVAGTWSVRKALRSERSTLLAIGVVLGTLAARATVA